MKLEDQQTYNWFIFSVSNSFDFTNIVLVLFPWGLFWTYSFLTKNCTNQHKWLKVPTTDYLVFF